MPYIGNVSGFDDVDTEQIKDGAVSDVKISDVDHSKVTGLGAEISTAVSNLVDSSPESLNTLNELAAALGDDPSFATTVTNSIATKLPLAGGTMTGDTLHGDSVKAKFGNADDLQIYHDGANSYIKEAGTGDLIVLGNNVQLRNTAFEYYLTCITDAGVTAYYNNVAKLSTTSTGVDITGITVSDGSSTNTAGTSNFVAGVNAGNSIVSGGDNNTLVGDEAGTAVTTGDYNVAVGKGALSSNTTGAQNTAIGEGSLESNTTGFDNLALGRRSLQLNTTGYYNTAAGKSALQNNTTGLENTATGFAALNANTTGSYNTASGRSALQANTTGSYNTATGMNALKASTTAGNNTAMGYEAMQANTTGVQNVALGMYALKFNTTAANNTALGYSSMNASTTGTENVGVGGYTLYSNTSGYFNVAAGYACLQDNTTGYNNVAAGRSAMQKSTTGVENVAIGRNALHENLGGHYNVALGGYALSENTSANYNTAIGNRALASATTGHTNTCVGYSAGAHTDSITTGADNTIIGAYANVSSSGVSYETVIGRYGVGQGTNTISLGVNRNGVHIPATGTTSSWSVHSDERLKENIVNSSGGLAFINDLRPVEYTWKARGDILDTFSMYEEGSETPTAGEAGVTYHGFIAQEMKATVDAHTEIKDGSGLWRESPDGLQNVAQGQLVPMLVKAIQELTARLEILEGS